MNERDFELLAARRACSLLTREQMLEGKVEGYLVRTRTYRRVVGYVGVT